MKKAFGFIAVSLFLAMALAGCSSGAASGSASDSPSASASASAVSSASQDIPLAPGKYTVDFKTDSSMFHANEADKGTGVLTVTDKDMTLHVRLAGKGIVNLYVGTADQAKADSANLLQPTNETVTYEDGTTDEVHAFDVPVSVIDEEFDLAILGEKGKWYDHKVSVSNPTALENSK